MRFVVAPFVVAALLLASPSIAQVDSREGIALQNQIYQLRQQLQALQDQHGAGGGGGNPAPAYAPTQLQGDTSSGNLVAQLLTRVDALEDQVRQLRGRIDEMQNQLQRQNDDLGKRIDDLAFQINPQGGHSPAAGPATQQRRTVARLPAAGTGPNATHVAAAAARPADAAGSTPAGDGLAGRATPLSPAAIIPAAEAAAREVLANRTSPRAYDAQLLLAQALVG